MYKVVRGKKKSDGSVYTRYSIFCDEYNNYKEKNKLEKFDNPTSVIADFKLIDGSFIDKHQGTVRLVPKLFMKETSSLLDQLNNKVEKLFTNTGSD